MLRIAAIFVAICMVLIAGAAGAILYLVAGLSVPEAAIVAVAVLTSLALYNAVAGRLRDREDVGSQIADISRGASDLARQVAELARRLAAIEPKLDAAAAGSARAAVAPLNAEIGELGALVKQLAQSVAAHDAALKSGGGTAASTLPLASPVESPATFPAPAQASLAAANSAAAAALKPEAILDTIRSAVDANRIDLYLQPIVSLPQRKVRYYEAMSRLRTEDGDLLQAADFIRHAEAGGLMPKIDNLILFRCVQVLRRLLLKNREIGLFCNVAGSTLVDPQFFRQFLEFAEANRAVAPSLVLEFTQSVVRAMGPIENESLAALADHGFRFSMDNVTDLRIEPRDLAQRGFKFIKVPPALMLDRGGGASAADIHSADLPGLLGRFGIDVVAEKIESESVVVDLLDCDVRFGQGFLFSPPRPVRQEALQGVGDRDDLVVREGGDAAPAEDAPAAAGRAATLAQLAGGVARRA